MKPPSPELEEGGFPDALRASLYPQARPLVDDALVVAARLAREWGVEIVEALPGATGSLILAAAETVLRVPLLNREGGEFLRVFAPHGGVPVLREDRASGATLLPRLRPGVTLDTLPEEEAVEVWIALVRRLRGAEGDAPSVEIELEPLWTEPTELRLATDVPSLAGRLVETSPAPRLLHGDLHHFNVLQSGETWVAIDPEGVVGDPAFEAAAFLRNPVPALAREPDLAGILRRRIRRIAEGLGEPSERVWGWALVRTALCVWGGSTAFEGAWFVVARALDDLGPELSGGLC